MNKCFIVGNVVGSPETRKTQTGKTVCNFSVAVNKRRGSENKATYFKITAWEAKADLCSKFIEKGKKVSIVGPVDVEVYMSKQGQPRANLNIELEDIEFLSAKHENQEYEMPPHAEENDGFIPVDEDSLPF